MKEYIDREAVIRLIKTEGFNEKYDLGHPKDNDWFCEEVNRIPAADVVEVRHGEWVWDGGVDMHYYCSLCHHNAYGNTGEIIDGEYKHCPNCGAKMDGGAE